MMSCKKRQAIEASGESNTFIHQEGFCPDSPYTTLLSDLRLYIKVNEEMTEQSWQNSSHIEGYFHYSSGFFESALAVYLDVCFGMFNLPSLALN